LRGLARAVDAALSAAEASELVMVVDQAEELLNQDERVRDVLLAELAQLAGEGEGAGPRGKVLFVVRLEFLTELERHASAAGCWGHPYVVPAMREVQIRSALEQPLRHIPSIRFEPGLVDRIVSDAGHGQQALPLVEFAVTSLWDHETGGVLTNAAYDQIGGVYGSVTRYAEQIWLERISDRERELAREIFLRLLRVTGEASPMRRPTPLAEFSPEQVALAQRLVTTRLLTLSGPAGTAAVLDLVHETLVTGWDRLRQWVETDTSFLAWRDRLRDDLQRWQAHGRARRFALSGNELTAALQWSAERGSDLTAAECEFIRVSTLGRRRAIWLTTGIVLVVVASLTVGIGYGVPALRSNSTAARIRVSQEAAQYLIARMNSASLSRDSLSTPDPEQAAQLAVAAYSTAATAAAQQALFDAYAQMAPFQAVIGSYTFGASASIDGPGTLVVLSHPTSTDVWQIPASVSQRRLVWQRTNASGTVISPNGDYLATIENGRAELWRTFPFRIVRSVKLPDLSEQQMPGGTPVLRFDKSGRYLAILGSFPSLLVWNLASGRLTAMHTPLTSDLAYARTGFTDNGHVYAVDNGGNIFAWNPATGATVGRPREEMKADPVGPSGDVVARCAGGGPGSDLHWAFTDPVTDRQVPGFRQNLRCHSYDVPVALAGHFLVTTAPSDSEPRVESGQPAPSGQADVASVIDTRTGKITGHAGVPGETSVAGVSASGDRVLVDDGIEAGFTALARLTLAPAPSALTEYRLANPPPASSRGEYQAEGLNPDASPTSPWPRVRISSARTGATLRTITLPTLDNVPYSTGDFVNAVSFLPDGTLLVGASGELTRWNVVTGAMAGRPAALAGPARVSPSAATDFPSPLITVDPAGRDEFAMTGPDGNTIELWQATRWHRIRVLGPAPGRVNSLKFSPDGTSIAVQTDTGPIWVFDARTGSVDARFPAPGLVEDTNVIIVARGYVAASTGDGLYSWRNGSEIIHVSAPSGLDLSISGERQITVSLTYVQDGLASPIGISFALPRDPGLWAAGLCQEIGPAATPQKLPLPGIDNLESQGC
jgi:WD40 repeat protein